MRRRHFPPSFMPNRFVDNAPLKGQAVLPQRKFFIELLNWHSLYLLSADNICIILVLTDCNLEFGHQITWVKALVVSTESIKIPTYQHFAKYFHYLDIFKKDSLAMSLIQHIKTFKFDEILEQIYKVFLELFSDLDILTILTVIATTTTAS